MTAESHEPLPDFFHPYIDATFDLDIFVELVLAGFGYAKVAPRVVELRKKKEFFEDRLKRAEKLEKFASEQEKYNFSYLYSIATVRLWTILENLVDDLLVHYLINYPETLNKERLSKLRVPLIDYLGASPTERATFLSDLIEQEVKAKFQFGVGRFELVLDAVGFAGEVAPEVRRVLFELSEVRNVIVHRNNKADRRLVERCPWLDLRVDNTVHISHNHFNRYMGGVQWYMLDLARRWLLRLDAAAESSKPDIEEIVQCQLEIQDYLVRAVIGNKPNLEI